MGWCEVYQMNVGSLEMANLGQGVIEELFRLPIAAERPQ